MQYEIASDELKEKRNAETEKTDRHDIDWRVEQRLAKVLAERDLFADGFIYGFLLALFIGGLVVISVWPELPLAKRIGK